MEILFSLPLDADTLIDIYFLVIPCCLFWKRYNLSQMAMPASNCKYTLRLNRLEYCIFEGAHMFSHYL